MGAAAAGAIMRRKEREVRAAFQSAGAVTAANAMSLPSVGIEENMAVRRLKRHAVIREASPGVFYFDETVWQALCAMRRRMAILLGVSILLVALMVLYGVVAFQ